MEKEIDFCLEYLRELSKRFTTKDEAIAEIINLNSILALPRNIEHFMSDIHGQADAFCHIMNNASGGIRYRIKQIFDGKLSESEQDKLATLIYYPEEKMKLELENISDKYSWYETNILRIIEVAKKISSRYTRSKVRKTYKSSLSYTIDELLNNKVEQENKDEYYKMIIASVINLGSAKDLIKALCTLIKQLAVNEFHIIGDIYDRGPEPHKIMDMLGENPNVDIQWGNHDILWMGASLGNDLSVAGVITNSVKYNNLDILENAYGINLRPLANFAENTYKNALVWRPRKTTEDDYIENYDIRQAAKIHKAISIIMYKLEGQFALNHPEYKMGHRRLLDKIDYENESINIDGKVYHLEDIDFPTIDRNDPYKLTSEEEKVIKDLVISFMNSEALKRHIDLFFTKGSMYKIENNNLMYHALVPLNENGTLKEVSFVEGNLKGKELFDYLDNRVRYLYYNKGKNSKDELDLMWYLWTGPDSPFFGKDKMTNMERVLIKDKSSHKEKRNYYYSYQEDSSIIENIMRDFGITDTKNAHIINGHIPVEKINGENPLKANSKLIVIDGGFSKAYQKTTGIAGYTLISGSTGMRIVAHEPFTSLKDAIINNTDINSTIEIKESVRNRITIADIDKGRELKREIFFLKLLIHAYETGIIKENNEYKYIKFEK